MLIWARCLQVGWTADDQVIFDHLWGRAVPGNKPAIAAPSILVWNKVDLVAPAASEPHSQSPLHTTFSAETRQSSTATAASSSMQDGSDGDVAAARYRGPHSVEQQHIASQTAVGVLSTPRSGFSARPEDLSSAGDAQPNSEAQPKAPTAWFNASNADSRPGSETVESSLDNLAGLISLAAATPTAADVTASATQRASQASSQSTSDLSAAPETVLTSSSNQSASGDQVSAVPEIPSSCADAFAACVKTCATTGLGLDALSAALLQLSDAPSLAAGSPCCICHRLLPKVVLNVCT